MKRWELGISFLLVGCASLTPTVGRKVDLLVYPFYSKTTQSILNPLTLSNIATLDIVPYVEVTTGTFSPISALTGNPTTVGAADTLTLSQASPTIDPNRPIVLRGLKPNKNYRIFGKAYNASSSLISLDNASYVDVAVGNNDAPAMAQLPVSLLATPFGATTSVTLQTDGRFDYLKGTLYLLSGNTQVALSQTTRSNPDFMFSNLQGNTNYRLVVEAYKLGTSVASISTTLNIANDTAPATASLALTVPYVAITLAGNGGALSADGVGTSAGFNYPYGLTVDNLGNIYVADFCGHRIRKVSPSGVVTTLVGNGVAGYVEGQGTAASFNNPHDVAVDAQGNVYAVLYGNHRIAKITPSGSMTVLAGNGVATFADGTGTAASFWSPTGITIDQQGTLYVVDRSNQRIRKISPSGVTTTLAGNGVAGYTNGVGTAASFYSPSDVAVDLQGNVYVAEWQNHCVRKITPGGVVSTLAGGAGSGYADGSGSAAKFNTPYGINIDTQGNLYVAEWFNHCIRRVTPSGVVTTLLGNGTSGFAEGTGVLARFSSPVGIAVDEQGILYVGDQSNQRIRKAY